MLLETLAKRHFGADVRVVQLRHVVRWRRWRRTKQVLHHPLAADGWRRAGRIRRDSENRTLRDDAAALFAVERHPLKLLTVDTLDAIVSRERSVHECERRVDEVEEASIFFDDGLDEHHRLFAHGIDELVVYRRKPLGIGLGAAEVSQLKPLRGPILHQVVTLRVGHHATYLSLE